MFAFFEWNDSTEEVDDLCDLVNAKKNLYLLQRSRDDDSCLVYSGFDNKIYYESGLWEVLDKATKNLPNGNVLAGLAKSVRDEDEDGMYDLIEEKNGDIEFCRDTDHPNDFSDIGVGCNLMTQCGLDIVISYTDNGFRCSVDGEDNIEGIDEISGYLDAIDDRTIVYYDYDYD
jgi:hypothetical protein